MDAEGTEEDMNRKAVGDSGRMREREKGTAKRAQCGSSL